MTEKKLKMQDIARLAQVSKTSVSLALNGKPGVSQATRERIFKVIEENQYQPLRKRNHGKQHKLINAHFIIVNKAEEQGMVTDNFRSLPFFNTLLNQISKNINAFGGRVQLENLSATNLQADLAHLQADNQVMAAIILGTELTQAEVELINQALPKAVFIDTYYPGISADFVTMDNFQGGYLAAKTILAKGYQRLGYVASKTRIANFEERQRGFFQALKEVGQSVNKSDYFTMSPTKMRADTESPLQSAQDLPQVVFCEDDYIAIRLIKEFREKGIQVPQDVAVMGFDDIYEGNLITPELTTIHVPVEQIVDQALHQLQCKVAWESWEPQRCLVSTRLVERESL